MNDLKIFENKEFGEIRTVVKDGEPWFVGKDVAEILGHSNPQRALRDYIDDDDKGVTKIVTPGGTQTMAIINESGLYSLILSSKLPNAKKFKKWVTSEVLPSIRKNGGYIAGQETKGNICRCRGSKSHINSDRRPCKADKPEWCQHRPETFV